MQEWSIVHWSELCGGYSVGDVMMIPASNDVGVG